MGINPFGEESDSLHAWKERYKQQQFQVQTLQSQLGEVKSNLQQVQVKLEEVTRQLGEREEELSATKQELKLTKELNRDKEKKILDLEKKLNADRLVQLERENSKLREKVEDLQGRINRGGGGIPSHQGSNKMSEITVALIPMMLHEFYPENPRYEDAFINLVETIIQEGDVLAKIVAVLIKYGGRGPVNKLRSMISSQEFDPALDTLIENNILVKIDNEVVIATEESEAPSSSKTEELTTEELFDNLLKVTNSTSDEVLLEKMEEFRDTLQNREVPLTTIFFEIRKVMERIEKERISRKDVVQQIKTWKQKFQSLST